MRKFTELPKTAHINIDGCRLDIENHRVTGGADIMGWVLHALRDHNWKDVVDALTSQGITFMVFIEHGMEELRSDTWIMVSIIESHYLCRGPVGGIIKFLSTDNGRAVSLEIINTVSRCKNWTYFHDTMKQKSVHHEQLKTRIMRDMKQ